MPISDMPDMLFYTPIAATGEKLPSLRQINLAIFTPCHDQCIKSPSVSPVLGCFVLQLGYG